MVSDVVVTEVVVAISDGWEEVVILLSLLVLISSADARVNYRCCRGRCG